MKQIKEVIQGKLDILETLLKYIPNEYNNILLRITERLIIQLQQAKSIEELLDEREIETRRANNTITKELIEDRERKAFEASREGILLQTHFKYEYDTFEDYLKNKENE